MEVKCYDYLPLDSKKIRIRVFMDEQGFVNEFDDIDNKANHIVIYDNGIALGTCRFFYNDKRNSYQLGRIAVLKEYRGRKIGNLLLSSAELEIKKRNGNLIELLAQERASKFYLKNGYIKLNEKEYDEGCPHIWMKKEIKK